MRNSSRFVLAAVAAIAALSFAGPAGACGTISNVGATIAPGNGSPDGSLTLDPCAGAKTPPSIPPISALGSLGSMTGTLPAFPGSGSGGSAFTAAANATIAGGTYDFTTYTVNAGVTVTYSGAVTIRTTGDVTISGLVQTTAAGASVTFLCGGDFKVLANGGGVGEGVGVTGSGADVTIDVAGSVSAAPAIVGTFETSNLRTTFGSISITSHAAAGSATMANAVVHGSTASSLRAAGGVSLTSCSFDTNSGQAVIQAYGGAAIIDAGLLASVFGGLLVEGARGVTIRNESALNGFGRVSIRGFGSASAANDAEDVVIETSSIDDFQQAAKGPKGVQAGGDIEILSAAGVRILGGTNVTHRGDGDIVVTAFGSHVRVETPLSLGQTVVLHDTGGTGDISISASTEVSLYGASEVRSTTGRLDVRSVTGVVRAAGSILLAATGAALDIRAGDRVEAADGAPVVVNGKPPMPEFDGADVAISAGDGGISLQLNAAQAATGALTMLTSGPMLLRGIFEAEAALTAVSTASNVDVRGASVRTRSHPTEASASVVIESYSGDGTIDATSATIQSGDSGEGQSGDVTVAIYGSASVVDSYFLPKKVIVKLNAKDAAKSKLTASGFFDSGFDVTDLSGAASLTVGSLTTTVTLAADRKGVFRHKDAAVDFQIVPSKTGSSRARFRLVQTGDFRGFLDAAANGQVSLRFVHGAVDGTGRVTLTKGSYILGRKRGALLQPDIFPNKFKAKLGGAGKDSLQFTGGLATGGVTPAAAPDVTISIGSTFSVTVTAQQFGTAKKDKFTAKSPAPGISSVTLDYLRETITLKGKGLTLDTFPPDSSVPLTIGVALGSSSRTVKVRMGHKGTAVTY